MIYLLEDDASIRELVIYGLESQKYEAVGFERPSEFWGCCAGQSLRKSPGNASLGSWWCPRSGIRSRWPERMWF